MRMKFKTSTLLLIAAVALTGCTSGQQPSGDAENAPNSTTETVVEGQLGKIETDSQKKMTDIPEVDKGLIISLPTATEYEVERNERINLIVGGLEPNTEAYIYVFHNLNGDNNAILNLKTAEVAADGSVSEYVNVPKSLSPGVFALTLESEDGLLYSAPIKVKE